MKITYLKLKNIANLESAMDASEIEIDFSLSKNRITLLNGPNGSGKTTILSCLHPFAYNGSGDDRSSIPLITIGKDGYKEIHIQNKNTMYVIKHNYIASKETHTVKSYIEKDGVELNPNGNVTSFKELVHLELGIEPDYLKLIRLGSNVTSLIKMKPTERKTYMGNLLDSVDTYLSFHKKVTMDLRTIKNMIMIITNKIDRLKITNIEEEMELLKNMKFQLNSLDDELRQLNFKKAVTEHEMGKLPSLLDINAEIGDLNEEIKVNKSIMNKRLKNIDLSKTIDDINASITKLKSKIEVDTAKRSLLISDTDSKMNELDGLRVEYDKQKNDEERQSLTAMIRDLNLSLENRKSHFKDMNPEYTSADIIELMKELDLCQNTLMTTYEFGEKPIQKVVKLMMKNTDVLSFIDDKLEVLLHNKTQSAALIVMKKLQEKFPKITVDCVNDKCILKQVWDEFLSLCDKEYDKTVEDDEFYKLMQLTYTNIQSVMKSLNNLKPLIIKMPKSIHDMFLLHTVLTKISKREWIYDKNVFNSELSAIREYEVYKSDKDKLTEYTKELDNLSSVKTQKFLFKRIYELEDYCESNKELIRSISETIKNNTEKLEDLESELEYRLTVDNWVTRNAEISNRLSELENMKTSMTKYNQDLISIKYQIDRYRVDVTNKQNEISTQQRKIDEYKSLTKDMKNMSDMYDEMILVQDSLSSKKGMPLIYIDLYLKKAKQITNDLLDIVYKGSLYIPDFDINADTFKIPYIRKGKTIPDAIYASQGEVSFITIALSFGIAMQSISDYNILLLDEIDSTLDTENRELFIKILERQLDLIGAEQVFLISHNNMFDMYPVDVIQTKPMKTTSELNNIIKITVR